MTIQATFISSIEEGMHDARTVSSNSLLYEKSYQKLVH